MVKDFLCVFCIGIMMVISLSTNGFDWEFAITHKGISWKSGNFQKIIFTNWISTHFNMIMLFMQQIYLRISSSRWSVLIFRFFGVMLLFPLQVPKFCLLRNILKSQIYVLNKYVLVVLLLCIHGIITNNHIYCVN